MQQFDKHFVSSPFETAIRRTIILHYKAVIPGSSRYMIYADLHGPQCPVRTCLWKGCQSWAHNSAQGTPRCSKERWGQQEGAKRHTRSLKTQTSKYVQTFHMNGPSGSSDLYICISEKPVGLSIHHLGLAKQISRATAKPMLFAVVGMGAKRTMPWRCNFGKANRTTIKHWWNTASHLVSMPGCRSQWRALFSRLAWQPVQSEHKSRSIRDAKICLNMLSFVIYYDKHNHQ